jgi:hypothetical protein
MTTRPKNQQGSGWPCVKFGVNRINNSRQYITMSSLDYDHVISKSTPVYQVWCLLRRVLKGWTPVLGINIIQRTCFKITGKLLFHFILVLISFICLFVCFEPHEQFFSYLAAITIAGDRAANLDLCLALSSEGSFTCHTYCDTGPPFLWSYPKDPWFSLLNAMLLLKE